MWSIYFIGAQSKLMGKAVYQYYCSVFVIGICPKNHQDQISFNKKHVRIPFFFNQLYQHVVWHRSGVSFVFPLNHKLTSKTWILNQQNKILRGQNFRKLISSRSGDSFPKKTFLTHQKKMVAFLDFCLVNPWYQTCRGRFMILKKFQGFSLWKRRNVPWKSMLGKCIPYWNSPFLGDIR